jgi:capsular exopolysaccharide synthesis family protein
VQEHGEDRGLFVIDPATLPMAPSNAPARQIILLGALLSLGLGVGVAAVIEYFNQPIETEDDVADVTGLPVLGWLPTIAGRRHTSARERTPINFVGETIPDTLPVEACRGIRTSLEWVSGQRELHTLMLASAGPGEGKSTVAVNLSWVFWELGRRLLLLDADLRRPALHAALGYPGHAGLADVLAGRLRLDAAGHPVRDGFTLLPAGSGLGAKPGVLLTAERLRPLLDTLKGQAELVIFDSAPVLAVADNLVLASLVDGVVLIARAGPTQRRDLLRAKEALERAGATLLGAVLNEVSLRDTRRHYGAYGDYYVARDEPPPAWWRRWRPWSPPIKGVTR